MLFACIKTGNAKERPAYSAGLFYPNSAAEIRQTVDKYLAAVRGKIPTPKPFAVIAPHAGYPYSGPVAAYSYAAVKGHSYDAVVVISPCHVDYFDFAAIYDGDAYLTPLGKLSVEKTIAQKLAAAGKEVQVSSKGHGIGMGGRAEHSLEVQLPFLQIVLGNIPIVPIVIGTLDRNVIEALGQQLGEMAKTYDLLIVASSDLSHYHDYDTCQKIDRRFMDIVESFSIEKLYRGLTAKTVEACGGGPIIATMIAAQSNNYTNVKLLHYANSGDVPFGDKSRVVGYMAAALYKENSSSKKETSMKSENPHNRALNYAEQKYLLQLAEDVIHTCVRDEPLPQPKDIPPICKEKRGAFVTIEKHGQLRGCIGYVLPVYPLYETVIEVAQSAALRDPRFNPVTPAELEHLEVEVSVLTVPEKIDDPAIIKVGKHGIIIKQGFYQGLLLPQVATDYGWDRETFLQHTCRKAGLPPDAWKDKNTEISIFSAQVFNRETLNDN